MGVECDHGRLKARLGPMRGLRQDRSARVIIAGHAFVQNLRRGHYELAVEEPTNRRATAGAGATTIPFADARLKIEVNATDGDAGLQVFLDGEPWRAVSLYNPSGRKLVEITVKGPLKDYGLTELFSESSEPPFDEFPLEQFKKLFPKGIYTFRGKTIDGKRLLGTARLTHDIPDGPRILRPRDEAQVARDHVVVAWKGVRNPPGSRIVGYQVVVTREDPLRVLSVDLPARARRLAVPAEFLQRGTEYKAEVLAIDAGGSQTLTEIAFTVK